MREGGRGGAGISGGLTWDQYIGNEMANMVCNFCLCVEVTQKLALQWLPCQTPGVIGSALGLVGPVSVYCDWVR